MKFPKRQKRGPICAHTAATTPIGLSPALAAVQHIVRQITPLEDPTQPKLRRKRKVENLHREHVLDAELTEIDPATGNWVAIPFGQMRTLSAPAIIITPPTPRKKTEPLYEAGGFLVKAAGYANALRVPRSLSLSNLDWLAISIGGAIANAVPYWQTSEQVEVEQESEGEVTPCDSSFGQDISGDMPLIDDRRAATDRACFFINSGARTQRHFNAFQPPERALSHLLRLGTNLPLLQAPIYRELNDLSTTFRFTWRVDGPVPSPVVFPGRPGMSWTEASAPVTWQQLNGIVPILRVNAQGPNMNGGTELNFWLMRLAYGYHDGEGATEEQDWDEVGEGDDDQEKQQHLGLDAFPPQLPENRGGATFGLGNFGPPIAHHYQAAPSPPFQRASVAGSRSGMGSLTAPNAYDYQTPSPPYFQRVPSVRNRMANQAPPMAYQYLGATPHPPSQTAPWTTNNMNDLPPNAYQYHSRFAQIPEGSGYSMPSNANSVPPRGPAPPLNPRALPFPAAPPRRNIPDPSQWEDVPFEGDGDIEDWQSSDVPENRPVPTSRRNLSDESQWEDIPYEGEGDLEDWQGSDVVENPPNVAPRRNFPNESQWENVRFEGEGELEDWEESDVAEDRPAAAPRRRVPDESQWGEVPL